MRAISGLHGSLDRQLVATCVSCGAHSRRWREALAADRTAVIRIAVDSGGVPVLRATFSDACEVCGSPEIKIIAAPEPSGDERGAQPG